MGGRGKSTSSSADVSAFDLAVQDMAKAELARRAALAQEKPKVPDVQAPQHVIDALESLLAKVRSGEVLHPDKAADEILSKVKGRELDALARHYSSVLASKRTASDKRLGIRDLVVGRDAGFRAMERIVNRGR